MLRKLSIAAAVLILASCATEKVDNQIIPKPVPEVDVTPAGCLPGMAVIEFDDATADMVYEAIGGDYAEGSAMTKAFAVTKSSGVEDILASLGANSISRIFPYAGKWEPRHREAGLHRFYRITFDENTPVTRATRSLAGLNGVVEVAMKPEIRPAAVPYNDPQNWRQWNLYNDGTVGRGFRSGMDINITKVWEEFATGSKDIVIAVVDGGVNMNHPDMSGVVIPGTEEGGSRCFVYGYEGHVTSSDQHGSHVAGVIAAINNNGIGVSSVAGGSDGTGGVRILSCQNLMESTDGSGKTLQGNSAGALVWGADQGAVISQNSWGYNPEYATGISPDDQAAIDYFIKYAGFDENGNQVGPMAGGIVLFAAGNDDLPVGWPAGYGPVIAVGALGPDGRKATYSNYGDWVDICAPGGESDRFTTNDAMILSLDKVDYYQYMAGTSQACPHVSGVAALLIEHFGGKGFTNDQLVDKLLYGADYVGILKDDQIGPKLNAYASFTIGDIQDPDLVSDHDGAVVLKSHETLTVKYTVRNKGELDVTFTFEGGSEAVVGEASADAYTVTFNALALEPGDYKAKLTASFGPGHATVLEIPYTVLANHAPKAEGMIPSQIAESKDAIEIDLSQYFKDEDGEQLTYTAEATTKTVVNISFAGDVMTLKPSAFGSTPVKITATDARGRSAELSAFTFLYYDMSKGVSAYPNPVIDYLNLCAGKEKEMKVVLSNANGVVLYEETVKGSALNPAKIDMKSFAPGTYGLTVSYDEVTSSKTIVKAL